MGAVKVAALLGMALLASATPPRDPQLKHARAVNAFGVSLLKELRSANEDANIFFSPVSISLALGLIYAGARGTSQSELSSVLGFSDADLVDRDSVMAAYKSMVETSTPNVTFDIANTILIKKGAQILDQYKQDLADYFQASARSVDFVRDGTRATEEVNEWVRAKTKGKISNLLGGSLPMNTMAFLLNAVYFKGTWVTKFRAGETKLLPFYNYGREEVKVRTMSLHGVLKCAILDELRAKAVAIPYAGNRFSMVVVLPRSKTQLQALESALSVDTIDKIISALAARQVHLLLPKFQLGTDYNLLPTLRKLGLESVFKSEAADLSGISGENGLSVSDVKHKAMVEVNEEGTVAAAVTSVRVRPRGNTRSLAVPLVLNFHVEHPFAFIIWDNVSKRAVFIGAVKKL